MLRMARRILFYFIVFIFISVFSFAVTMGSNKQDPVILMYHSVGEPGIERQGTLNITPEAFEKQMAFLYRHHYRVISLLELERLIKADKKIPSKTVVVTFDDGYENNFSNAFPVLKKYGFPATIFVIADYVGKKKEMYGHVYSFLSPDELRVLADSGLITIGSHTRRHPYLPKVISKEELLSEIEGSQQVLEGILHRPVLTFSYPVGGFNRDIKALVQKAGYEVAVTIKPAKGRDASDVFSLGRIKMTGNANNFIALWIKFSGYYLRLKEL